MKFLVDIKVALECCFFFFSRTTRVTIHLLIALLILLPSITYSQKNIDSTKVVSTVNQYIAKYDSVIGIKISANSEYDFLSVKGDDFFYDIRPNISVMSKLSISYRHFTVSYGIIPRFFPGNNDDDMQGNTKAFSIGFQVYTNHWVQELRLVKIKGFYIHNTGDFDSEWEEGKDPYLLIPELHLSAFRGATGYKFNPNYSMRAHSNQTERQLKSCGSLLALLDYDWFTIDNSSNNPEQNSSQTSHNLALSASLGYMYTFVLSSKFYISAGLLPGAGYQFTNLLTRTQNDETETRYSDPFFRMAEKAGIGYNNNRFFAGGEISLAQSFKKQKNTTVHTKSSRAFIQVFAGYRINWDPLRKK